jgi:hypothetical protein
MLLQWMEQISSVSMAWLMSVCHPKLAVSLRSPLRHCSCDRGPMGSPPRRQYWTSHAPVWGDGRGSPHDELCDILSLSPRLPRTYNTFSLQSKLQLRLFPFRRVNLFWTGSLIREWSINLVQKWYILMKSFITRAMKQREWSIKRKFKKRHYILLGYWRKLFLTTELLNKDNMHG